MNTQEKAKKLIKILKKLYPEPKIELKYENPIQLLVAVILSAQCTDKRVNIVTESLFKKYKTVKDFANADLKTLEKEIFSTGFYKNKAGNIIGAAKMIEEKFWGKVPETMEELVKLPGVARKTANVVLWVAFGKNEGVTVDTHVIRLSQQLGLTKAKTPEKIEQDLMQLIPREKWGWFSLAFVLTGRYISPANKKCTLEMLEEAIGK
ncbi:MAG: endonuclease III, endonuclease III [Candidatus Peregrinibacteria bacterium GW2011_GWF2_38_29]|nr:MAG: endonuclease III, endonuclease III [Candidatus Peregrinibacteria bacterium GW2011_GWF2_38_29]HBB02927.1 endonuclease III [Candidatus Peregrinibacteria bacterium]